MRLYLRATVDVTPICVGRIRLPERHVRARRRTLPGRYLDIRRDGSRLDALPIWCWLVDHPDGRILVDVGETTDVFEPGGVDLGARLLVDRDGLELDTADELAVQLRRRGVSPASVETIVLTHLHFDHAGAVDAFPNAEVLVARREYRLHRHLPLGSALHRWPDGLTPTLLEFEDEPVGPFAASHRLTTDGVVRIVPTPGHTPGHQSVLVSDGDELLCLAGDTTFTERQLVDDEIVGIALNARSSRRTMRRIRRLCARERVVYLPSHDPGSPDRLEARAVTTIASDRGEDRGDGDAQ